jgi:drug/metabolite transporter (DMT)-like permease
MSPQKIFQQWPRTLQAVFIMLIAIFMISIMNLCAKLASPYHDPIEIVFYRGVFGLICLMTWLIFSRRFDLLKTSRPWTHAGRSVIGTIGVTMVFWAYALMPMADVSALLLTSSLFVTALSAILLKERVGVWRWSAVVIGLLGALIVAAPTGMNFNFFGFGVAMGAAITVAFVSIFLRALGKTEHAFTTVFYFVLTGTLASGCYMIFKGTPPDPAAWWALAGTGATAYYPCCSKHRPINLARLRFYRLAPIHP